MRQARACAAAFTFLTRVPVYRVVPHDADDLAGAAAYFPIVGLVVGLVGSVVYAIGVFVWLVPLAIVLCVAATVLLTGAFHEDALADAFDGFGGGWDATQVLAIMKDSRVGSYALIGVLLVVLAKLAALWSIADAAAGTTWAVCQALIAAHVTGRWSSVALLSWQPYVRPIDPTARTSAGRAATYAVTRAQVMAATIVTAVVLAVAVRMRAVPVIAIALVVTWCAGRYFHRRIGGVTGDALGAANQIVEVCVYLTLAAHVARHM
jgi:adenosylcobinamide-GDP ribazoletransferase